MEELIQAINKLNAALKQEIDPILDKLCRMIESWINKWKELIR
jgi:hypothetical protein